MRNTVIWSFLSMVALASGGLVAGCDSDEKLARSALGESCAKTSDCDDGLRCLDGTCYQPSSGTAGSSTGAGGDGTGVTGPKPAVLGGEGESCSKRADCEDGLGCFSGRCSKDASGEGGEGNGGGIVVLGGVGETCGLTTDCQKGLRCLPSDGTFFPEALAVGSNSVGVCTPTDSGLEPTGNSCYECAEAADCCELPVPEQAAVSAKSCADLAVQIGDSDCTSAAIALLSRQCLAYSAYCEGQCAKDTWACTAGKCEYTAKCTETGTVYGGCPEFSRGGNSLGTTCEAKTGKCGAAVGCKKDAECVSTVAKPVLVFDDTADQCSEGECTCQVETGRCYRKCAEELDCGLGYTCDGDTSLCVKGDICKSDAQCAVRTGDIRYKCVSGACEPGCEHDTDCSSGGSLNGGFRKICGPEKTCISVGCEEDVECSFGSVRGFCAKTIEAEPASTVASAVTD